MINHSYRTKRDLAVELLRDSIIHGVFAPGERLLLEDLSQRYDLSMTPIREAFSILESEGLIHLLPHKGAVVAEMDREELQELYAIRGAMESLATRHGVPQLSDADLREMEGLLAFLEQFDGSWETFLEHDRTFHRIIYRAAGRKRWMSTIETLWQRCHRYMLASALASGPIALHNDHRAILDACLSRDAERAAAAVAEHLRLSEERLLGEW